MPIDLNFSVDDVKEMPLLPDNEYNGAISKTSVHLDKAHLAIDVVLNDNEGLYMTDGETPADGVRLTYKIWLPKTGDENEPTASGRGNKRDSKIRSLFTTIKFLGLSDRITTPQEFINLLQSGDLIGLPVSVKTSTDTYNGTVYNKITTLQSAE